MRSALGWLSTVAWVMFYLHVVHDQPPVSTLGVSLFAGSFASIALGLVFSVGRTLRERKLLKAGLAGLPPRDGQQAALVGRITPQGAALVAPLSGASCVAYTYEIFEQRGSGRQAMRLTHYKGVGLTPSSIATPAGSFRLLAVPEFPEEAQRVSGDAGLRRAAEYLRSTTFIPFGKTSARALEQRWSDSDGAYRSDVASVDDPAKIELTDCSLAEAHIPPGAAVCVLGRYSQSQGGIVAHPNWGYPTRLILGNPERVARTLRSQVATRSVLAFLFGAASAGAVAAFVANLSQR